jgi:hypothetical protein
VALGQALRFTAVAHDIDGNQLSGAQLQWASSSPAVATIDTGGNAVAVGPGSTTIRATSRTVSGEARLVVRQALVMLQLEIPVDTITAISDTVRASVTGFDATDHVIPDVPVVWSSSDPLVATVDPTGGMITAVGNGITTVTAGAGLIRAEQMLAVRQVVDTVVVTPGADSLLVNATAALSYRAADRRGNTISDEVAPPVWSSADPRVAAVTATGIVRGTGIGATDVRVTVDARSASAAITVREPPPLPIDTTTRTGTVVIPPGLDTAAVYVETTLGGAGPVAGNGDFALAVSDVVESLVSARSPIGVFAFAVATPDGTTPLTIDAMSTAVAMVYLSPVFSIAPKGVVDSLLEVIGDVPEVQQLAAVIDDRVATDGVLPDLTDGAFAAAVTNAVTAAHARLASLAGFTSARDLMRALFDLTVQGSGVTIITPTTVTPTPVLEVWNTRSRDVDLYVIDADDAGSPLEDQSQLTNAFAARRLQIPPADYVPDLTSLADWLRLLRGEFGATGPLSVPLEFDFSRSRYLVYAYGAGILNLPSDLTAIEGTENARWAPPLVMTSVFLVAMPVIEVLSGFDLLSGYLSPEAYELVRAVVDPLLAAMELNECAVRDATAVMLTACVLDAFYRLIASEPALLSSLMIQVAQALGREIAEVTAQRIAETVVDLFAKVGAVSTMGDLLFTGYAIGLSELRQEFDLSYNGLLGAAVIAKVGGDNQDGVPGGELPEDVAVRVTDRGGNPVPNAWVRWIVEDGSGSVSQETATTGPDGTATTRWVVSGDRPIQGLRAVLAGTTVMTRFEAWVVRRIFAESGTVFLGGAAAPSDLYGVIPSPRGRDVLIGRLQTTSGAQPVVTDQALAPDGTLWAVSFSRLYRVDTLTAVLTDVGSLGSNDVNALAAAPGGTLYGATVSGNLVQINTASGAAAPVGSFGSGLQSAGDLAFAPDGTLYAAVQTWQGAARLATVNRSTGQATVVNPETTLGLREVWGLVFVGNQLFGLTTDPGTGSGLLIWIDTASGTGTVVRSLAFDAFGAGPPGERE